MDDYHRHYYGTYPAGAGLAVVGAAAVGTAITAQEQQRRFLERLENADKHWKFSAADLAERAFWDRYMAAYEDALSATSTDWAPWYIVPADHKWATRAVVADILTTTIGGLDLRYPEVTAEQRQALQKARAKLDRE